MTLRHIHFIGIGGAGLSALAQVMLERGYTVSGSDPAAPNPVTNELEKRGATIFSGHDARNIAGADLIVVTSAAQASNPEVAAAHLQQIPTQKRREFLREVTRGYDVIAVAGSHGKTTTTAMIAKILESAGQDPTVVVGGVVPDWRTNARTGSSKWFVIEADEYDYAFLGLEPKITVLTNVDYDHPDLFPTRAAYATAFADFLKQTRTDGVIIVCGEEQTAHRLANEMARQRVTYGVGQVDDWRAVEIESGRGGRTEFEVEFETRRVGSATLSIPGQHNVLNALAAMAATHTAGVSPEKALAALAQFRGVERRFQVLGTYHGATIVEDYAHHPTELRVNISAARTRFPKARLIALFQPHTYSRTAALIEEFAQALSAADRVIVTEIFAAREQNTTGLSSRELVKRIRGAEAQFVETPEEAEQVLRAELGEGDALLVFGAGNVNRVAIRLIENGNA